MGTKFGGLAFSKVSCPYPRAIASLSIAFWVSKDSLSEFKIHCSVVSRLPVLLTSGGMMLFWFLPFFPLVLSRSCRNFLLSLVFGNFAWAFVSLCWGLFHAFFLPPDSSFSLADLLCSFFANVSPPDPHTFFPPSSLPTAFMHWIIHLLDYLPVIFKKFSSLWFFPTFLFQDSLCPLFWFPRVHVVYVRFLFLRAYCLLGPSLSFLALWESWV